MTQRYPLPTSWLRLTIGGEDRTDYLIGRTLQIHKVLGAPVDIARFSLKQPETWRAPALASIKPSEGQEVIIEVAFTGSDRVRPTADSAFRRLFGGFIQRIAEPRFAYKTVSWEVSCTDYTALLNRKLVKEIYADQTVYQIVLDMMMHYAPGVALLPFVQITDRQIAGISFNYRYPADCLNELAGLIGWEWYVDEFKQLHFFDPLSANRISQQPLTDTSKNFDNLRIEPQLDQVRNRVYVQGGEALSDHIDELFVCDGSKQAWTLENKGIVDISVTLNGTPKVIGIQGAASPQEAFDFLVEANAGTVVLNPDRQATPADLDRLIFTYRYRYPLFVMVEDKESQRIVASLASDFETVLTASGGVARIGPQAYWPLDEPTGFVALDTVHGFNGAYVNVDLGLPGPVLGALPNYAASFNGSSSVVTVADASNGLRIGHEDTGPDFENWAVAIWFKPDFTQDATKQTLYWRGDEFEIRYNDTTRPRTVELALQDAIAITFGGAPVGVGGAPLDNDTQMQVRNDNWHMALYSYSSSLTDQSQQGLTGWMDGLRQFHIPMILQIGQTGSDTSTQLRLGDNNLNAAPFKGRMGRVTVWKGTPLDDAAALRIWAAGQEDGVREVRITAGDASRAVEARNVGELELAQWSRIITEVHWGSHVGLTQTNSGTAWRLGETVPVVLTAAGAGRTFSGGAKIQSITITALGTEGLRWDMEAQSARFTAIDFYRQLVRSRDVIPGREGATLNLSQNIIELNQIVLSHGITTLSGVGFAWYVVPDATPGGVTPYALVEFSTVNTQVMS